MMHVFSCGVPVYFFSLGLAAAVKFYMSVVAAFSCVAVRPPFPSPKPRLFLLYVYAAMP